MLQAINFNSQKLCIFVKLIFIIIKQIYSTYREK